MGSPTGRATSNTRSRLARSSSCAKTSAARPRSRASTSGSEEARTWRKPTRLSPIDRSTILWRRLPAPHAPPGAPRRRAAPGGRGGARSKPMAGGRMRRRSGRQLPRRAKHQAGGRARLCCPYPRLPLGNVLFGIFGVFLDPPAAIERVLALGSLDGEALLALLGEVDD